MNINSVGKKVLIFSDVHMQIDRVRKIIKHEAADINVFLGDLFDTFDKELDQPDYYNVACEFLDSFQANPNNVYILANHDLPYLMKFNPSLNCSGYKPSKHRVVDKYFNCRKTWRRWFKFHVFVDDYLCTHAGLHPRWLGAYTDGNFESIDAFLNHETKKAELNIELQQKHWFWAAGYARGGDYSHGGLVWMDAHDEAEPIDGVKQIYGHSHSETNKIYLPQNEPIVADLTQANNLCIDANLNEWLTITDGKMEIKRLIDL
jgi:hypothetical protein